MNVNQNVARLRFNIKDGEFAVFVHFQGGKPEHNKEAALQALRVVAGAIAPMTIGMGAALFSCSVLVSDDNRNFHVVRGMAFLLLRLTKQQT